MQFSGCKKLFPLKTVISAEQFKEKSVLKMKMQESILQLAQLSKQNENLQTCKKHPHI